MSEKRWGNGETVSGGNGVRYPFLSKMIGDGNTMENTKTCPKCGTEMKAAGYEMVLPAMNDSRVAVSARPISDSAGMSVSPFYCPNCAFVELYFLSLFRPAV